MTKNEIVKLLDGWFSKKWIIVLLCFVAGTLKSFTIGLTDPDYMFFLGLPGFYFAANVANKVTVLKNMFPPKKNVEVE